MNLLNYYGNHVRELRIDRVIGDVPRSCGDARRWNVEGNNRLQVRRQNAGFIGDDGAGTQALELGSRSLGVIRLDSSAKSQRSAKVLFGIPATIIGAPVTGSSMTVQSMPKTWWTISEVTISAGVP